MNKIKNRNLYLEYLYILETESSPINNNECYEINYTQWLEDNLTKVKLDNNNVIFFGTNPKTGRLLVDNDLKEVVLIIYNGIECKIGQKIDENNHGDRIGYITFKNKEEIDCYYNSCNINSVIKPNKHNNFTLVFNDNLNSINAFKSWMDEIRIVFNNFEMGV